MTIQEMKEKKRELGYSIEALSRMSGVPAPTIQKVFSGTTKSPRRSTVRALERVLSLQPEDYPPAPRSVEAVTLPELKEFFGPSPAERKKMKEVREAAAMYGTAQARVFTIDDLFALPEGIHAELMDGRIYYMAPPSTFHQEIIGELYLIVASYIKAHSGKCKVFLPEFGVSLFADGTTFLKPDLTVVCDPDKLRQKGCYGAPDWVVEVVSPSSIRRDCLDKLIKYRAAKVQEYWIIYPEKRIVQVYLFREEEQIGLYTFEDAIPCSIFPDLSIKLADVL